MRRSVLCAMCVVLFGGAAPLSAGVTITYTMTSESDFRVDIFKGLNFVSVHRLTPRKGRIDMRVVGAKDRMSLSRRDWLIAKILATMGNIPRGVVLTRLDEETIYSDVAGRGFKKKTFGDIVETREKAKNVFDPAFWSHYRWTKLARHEAILGCGTVGYEVATDRLQGTLWFCRAPRWSEAEQFYKNNVAVMEKYDKDPDAARLAAEVLQIPTGALMGMDATANVTIHGKMHKVKVHMWATSIRREDYDESIFEPTHHAW